MTLQNTFLLYLAFINALTFFVFAFDKTFAQKGSWRVRERTLLILALCGGTPAALFAMQSFRHKTQKTSFNLLLALILLVQLAGVMSFLFARP